MKFVWLQDLDPMIHGGGAQLTDRRHIVEGIRRGHDIEIVTPETMRSITGLAVISNAHTFNIGLFQEMVAQGRPYIWFFHDYSPACKYRLFYPMQDSCKQCYLKERWLPIFMAAKLLIWLSPLHRESWLWLYPEIEKVPYHLAPSAVDPSMFYDMKLERRGVLVVEGLHPFKGRAHVFQWVIEHSDIPVTCIGGDPESEPLPQNCTVIGSVPYKQMNELYNRHEVLLHLPQSPSPFDRTVPEARLAGCKVIVNSLVGAMSWEWMRESRESIAEHLSESPRGLWEAVEGVLQ